MSPLWLHFDLYPTSGWPCGDTQRFGEALSVTSSITTSAARLQVLPLSLAAAALSSFRLLLYIDVTLSFSSSTFLPSFITPSNLTVTLIRVQLSDVQINIIPACHALNPSVYQNFLPHCLNILFSPSFSPSFLKGWKLAEERLVLVSEAIELGWLAGRALTETHILCWKNVLNRHPVWGLSHCCPKLTVTAL